MYATSYSFPVQPLTLDDTDDQMTAQVAISWLGDYDVPEPGDNNVVREFTLADAMAASGDYFITLATRLDKLAQGMPQDSAEQIELEHQVKLLFYMQDHYDLVAKYKRR